ncbi:glutamate--tRNA ligase [Alicyclobacillus sp. SO9]|uniref:glutamate--tRNA ligase n=1 Tax=Alicyclobacillus sp. SO9 TaxID=2665646 RepID=UPI0018E805D9|nr:glutamate--tRNA ligase [Alicyclobacillus sp. SO9]QQE78549.1 glutamate--tRNA ligase [Alicyclobacillus sp. SO9]
MTVRVRYAPSPTGHLHIGGVRTALFNYLYARHNQGQFILRFEDTDLDRNVAGAEEEMLKGFKWLGFEWEEGPDRGGPFGPYRCTQRLDIYRDRLEKLKGQDQAYPCFCTSEELEEDRQRALAEGRMPRYSGRCRHLSESERREKMERGLPYNWRFAIPAGIPLEFEDDIRGQVHFESDDIGDFVIVKSNGLPTYNFQVVLDDALMEITHVIRGEEHLSNTPRQLLIYRALGYQPPKFAHLPQVLNEDRKKLSKRDPNVLPVHSYRERGYLSEALVNFLALLGWSPGGEEEIMSLDEIAQQFSLDRVGKSGAVFDVGKLNWMSGQYMKRKDLPDVTEMVAQDLERQGVSLPLGRDREWLETVTGLYQEQMTCAADFAALAKGFFQPDIDWSDEAREVIQQEGAEAVIRRYRELTQEDTQAWTAAASKARFKRVQKELGVKGRGLFMPVRAALTGEVHGPDLQQTVACLPKEWVLARLDEALHLTSAAQ